MRREKHFFFLVNSHQTANTQIERGHGQAAIADSLCGLIAPEVLHLAS